MDFGGNSDRKLWINFEQPNLGGIHWWLNKFSQKKILLSLVRRSIVQVIYVLGLFLPFLSSLNYLTPLRMLNNTQLYSCPVQKKILLKCPERKKKQKRKKKKRTKHFSAPNHENHEFTNDFIQFHEFSNDFIQFHELKKKIMTKIEFQLQASE